MSGSIWDVLGIDPTDEVAAIRRAYATRLKQIKRDLDPHEFQELRAAYETALSGVGGSNAPLGEERPQAAPVEELLPVQRLVIAGDEAPPRRQRWKEIVGALGDAPPPGKRRQRDVEVVNPWSVPDERQRVEYALAEVREAMAPGERLRPRAIAAFNDAFDRLSHPVTGVSIAALAGFERELVRTLIARLPEGETIVAVARAASVKFRWPERMGDVHAASEPLAQSLTGFLAAEEIARCARGGSQGPVERSFAQDLFRPMSQQSFAYQLMTRGEFRKRRSQFEALAAMPGDPLAWLPSANVAWLRSAFSRPRLYPLSAILLTAAVIVPISSILSALMQNPVVFPLGLGFTLATSVCLVAVAVWQDIPALKFLQPLWRGGNAVRDVLEHSWTALGVELPLRVFVIYPLLWALFLAPLMFRLPGQSVEEAWGPIVSMVTVIGGFSAAIAIYMVASAAFSKVKTRFNEWSMRKQGGISTKRKVAILLVAAITCVAIFAGISVAEGDREALSKMKDAGAALVWLTAIAATGYAAWKLVGRLPPRAQPWTWGGLGALAISSLIFTAEIQHSGPVGAAGTAFATLLVLALTGGVLWILVLLVRGSMPMIGTIEARIRDFSRRRFPALANRGFEVRTGACAAILAIGISLFAYMGGLADLPSAIGAGVFWGGVVFMLLMSRRRP